MFEIFSVIWKKFKEYIVLVLLLIISLIILSSSQKQSAKKASSVFFGVFANFSSVISDALDIAKYKSENSSLRKTNAELMLEINKLRQYGIENSELKDLLGIKDTLHYPILPANVVSKSLSRSQGTFTLNVGRRDSVRPGMPVINEFGLVGIVYSTSSNYSIVRTLENLDLSLTVKDERSRVDGIMKWNGANLVIINVPKTFDVEPGDRIITSDLSSIVAMPVPIGVVVGLNNVETGIFNEVKLKPFVDFVTTENVFVIKVVESKEEDNLELNFFNRK
ncbi:MAG TPA: rod shape-determining protein MreC [Ignavibacteriaceae bacterium]|nr:rod shape-determining protein MreC [Ignavibacteriaceae bacterium]